MRRRALVGNASRAALVAAAAAAPALATLWLVQAFLRARLSDFVPSVWNDQTGYWHEILSFAQVGFKSGYYVPNEHAAALGLFHFDVGGPAFPAAYGSIASVVGWSLDTSIYVNLVMIAVGIALFCLVTGLDRRQIAAVGVICLAFGPILLYLPTSSQESAQQAIAMGFAAMICILVSRQGNVSRPMTAGMLAFAVAASLMRYSWVILILAILVLAVPRWSTASLRRPLALAGLVTAGILVLVASTSAPGGSAPLERLSRIAGDPVTGTRDLVLYTVNNLRQFLFDGGVTGLLGVQVTAVLAASVGMIVLGRSTNVERREWTFHFLNLGLTLVASLVLYLPAGYYRLIGAHLLLSLLVMVRFRHFLLVGAVTLTMALATPLLLNAYREWAPNFAFDQSTLGAERTEMQQYIRYDGEAASPWCNTILIPINLYDWRVTLVPAGVGASYIVDHGRPLELPLKSRWVLLDPGPSEVDDQVQVGNLRALASFSFGRLFENPASACGSGR